jgi:PAS domain S-box-containing protein
MGVRRLSWVAYLSAGLLGCGLYFFVPPFHANGLTFNVLGATAALAILLGVFINRPARRLPWYLLAVGQALFVSGDVIAYNYERFFHAPLPFPSAADVLYLSVYPALVAGLLILIRGRNPSGDRASLIDSLIITLGVGLLSWVFLMAPYAHNPSLSTLRQLISIAYPVMDLLVLSVVVRLAVGPGERSPALKMLLGGSAILFVTDSIYGWILLHGNYQVGSALDFGWLAFYLLLGAATLHPSMRDLGSVGRVAEPGHARRRVVLLSAASLISPAVLTYLAGQGRTADAEIVGACSALLLVLVLYRLGGLMVDVAEYRRQERHLRIAEAKYRTVVEQIPAIVYIDEEEKDAPGRYRSAYVSPQSERILGYEAAAWRSDPDLWTKLLHPQDREFALAQDARTNATNEPFSLEYRLIAHDGQVVWVRDQAILMDGEEGRLWHGVMFDVTSLKLAEAELRARFVELRDSHQERRRLVSKLVTAQEEERASIASDIHDDSVQKVTAALMRLDMLRAAHIELGDDPGFIKAQHSVQQAIQSMRHLMFELRPAALDRDGLVAALRLRLEEETKLASSTSYHVDGGLAVEPPSETRIVLYRITQEALTNIRKHARASRVGVSLGQREGGYLIRIEDDGIGFTVGGRAESPDGHLGLTSMRERAEIAGGWLTIESAPEKGTVVQFWVPGDQEDAREAV